MIYATPALKLFRRIANSQISLFLKEKN